MRARGPFSDSYAGAVVLVVLALVPFLLLTAAVFPLLPQLSAGLHLSEPTLDMVIAASDAAYAFGTVLAVQFAVHLPPRRMLLGYVTTFLMAALIAAWAPSGPVWAAAFIVEGLCTSLMLIAAVPPLVTGWPPAKMPWTGGVMNMCIFGAVALGPTLGALEASSGSWHPLFWGVAGLAALAVIQSLLTYEDEEPKDPSAPWDFVALGLSAAGCGASFYGAARLQDAGPVPGSLAPLLAGIALIVVLVIYEYRIRRPLMPLKALATAFPVGGIVAAMSASAAGFGLMELVLESLKNANPVRTGVLFLPEFGAAVLTAVLFGVLFRTRFTPLLAISGLVVLTATAAVLTAVGTGSSAVVAVSAGLMGFGVAASVSPAMFVAGFSLRSAQIQRVFALIELLRGVTAFLIAPILLYLAIAVSPQTAIWTCLAIAAVGGVVSAALFLLSGGRLQTPDLQRWESGEPAWDSPPLLQRTGWVPLAPPQEDTTG